MKSAVSLGIVCVLAAAALIIGERRRANAPVTAAPIVNFIAGAERDISRVPMALSRLSDDDEQRYGDQLAAATSPLPAQSGTPDDDLNRLGRAIAAHAHRQLLYRFHYIASAEFVNAFAAPGGHVYIGQGLIELMRTDDELAAVLAHEIEHVDHYHCAERLQTEAAIRTLPLGLVAAIPLEVFQAGYSKDEELEADREGVRLAAAAGYSPLGAIDLFEALDAKRKRGERSDAAAHRSPAGEVAGLAGGALEAYFQSHPPIDQRIAQVREIIQRERLSTDKPSRPIEPSLVHARGGQ